MLVILVNYVISKLQKKFLCIMLPLLYLVMLVIVSRRANMTLSLSYNVLVVFGVMLLDTVMAYKSIAVQHTPKVTIEH